MARWWRISQLACFHVALPPQLPITPPTAGDPYSISRVCRILFRSTRHTWHKPHRDLQKWCLRRSILPSGRKHHRKMLHIQDLWRRSLSVRQTEHLAYTHWRHSAAHPFHVSSWGPPLLSLSTLRRLQCIGPLSYFLCRVSTDLQCSLSKHITPWPLHAFTSSGPAQPAHIVSVSLSLRLAFVNDFLLVRGSRHMGSWIIASLLLPSSCLTFIVGVIRMLFLICRPISRWSTRLFLTAKWLMAHAYTRCSIMCRPGGGNLRSAGPAQRHRPQAPRHAIIASGTAPSARIQRTWTPGQIPRARRIRWFDAAITADTRQNTD
jgi:hypothetical protein